MTIKATLAGLALVLVAGLAGAEDNPASEAILDFGKPPSQLYPARLVELDGRNLSAPVTKTSFWVEPGVHEIVVVAGINDPMKVGSATRRSAGDNPGKTTIEVEAGKRYRIAAMTTDSKGNWEPVIWKVEDL